MAVYGKSGNALSAVYGINGAEKSLAYDKSGNIIYSKGNRLKVMEYNVGQWYIGNGYRVPTAQKSEYYNLQYGTFANNPVDILFMQEYLNSWCVDGSLASEFIGPFFDHQEVTSPTGYIGHSICTKQEYPMSNYTSHAFTTNKGNYPSFESAEITAFGKTITIVNTHNDYVLSYQRQEVTDLLAFLSGLDYFILCGDFNIDLAVQETTGEQYQNSVQRFLDAGYHVGNCVVDWIPTYFGTSSPTGGKFTDEVITSSNIDIVSLYAYTAKLTDGIHDKIDHIPLIAELEIH